VAGLPDVQLFQEEAASERLAGAVARGEKAA
jgi:hypothetical protein